MTPESQRIAIAEACGITICPSCNHQIDPEVCWCGCLVASHGYESGHPFIPAGCTCSYEDADKRRLERPDAPDYPSDLNAMHEAEKTLHINDHDTFRDRLASVCMTWWMDEKHYTPHAACATAAQRAEAFLRTLNLWTE